MDSATCWKHLTGIHADSIVLHSSCRFFGSAFMQQTSSSQTFLLSWHLDWAKVTGMLLEPSWSVILLEVSIWKRTDFGHKGIHLSVDKIGSLWHSNDAPFVLKGSVCTSPLHHMQPELRTPGRMNHGFMWFLPNPDPATSMLPQKPIIHFSS